MKLLAAILRVSLLFFAAGQAAHAEQLWVEQPGYTFDLQSGQYAIASPPDVAVQLKDPREARITLEKGAKFCGSYRITVGEQEILSAKVSDPAMCSLRHD